jgi:hypothetical protein
LSGIRTFVGILYLPARTKLQGTAGHLWETMGLPFDLKNPQQWTLSGAHAERVKACSV